MVSNGIRKDMVAKEMIELPTGDIARLEEAMG